jgi:hypothetical protein
MEQRKYEVRGVDPNGDVWVVGTDLFDTAEGIAEKLRQDGCDPVEIVEN